MHLATLLAIVCASPGCSLILPPRDTGRVLEGVICLPEPSPGAPGTRDGTEQMAHQKIDPCRTPG